MSYHVSAFYQAALGASSSAVIVPAVLDQSINVQNSRIQPYENRKMIGGWSAGTSLSIMEVDSATLILNGRPCITPVNVVAPGGNLPGVEWPGERGFTLPKTELIGLLATTDASGAADTYGALFHTKGLKPIAPGDIRTVRATAACAGVKGSWWLSPLAFITYLADGKYALVGASVDGANLALSRFVFPMQMDRPGLPGVTAAGKYVQDYFRFGRQGVWGVFDNYNPPQLECLGFGTVATQNVFLDLMRVG